MINQILYKIKKGANLSRVIDKDGKWYSDNIKAPKTITLRSKNLVNQNFDDQFDLEFFEFKHRTYGEFMVHSLDLTIIERKI